MPEGKRRTLLSDRFKLFVDSAFKQRMLIFDEHCSTLYGELMAEKRRLGYLISCFDGQIAAIARVHGFSLATRNC